MLPWHAIPFLKSLGMLTPKPTENGWPRLWRSCKWQQNTHLIIQWLRRSPVNGRNKLADVSPLLKLLQWRSGASPKGPEGALLMQHTTWLIILLNKVKICHKNYLYYLRSSLFRIRGCEIQNITKSIKIEFKVE